MQKVGVLQCKCKVEVYGAKVGVLRMEKERKQDFFF